jgi:hypothetical protein
VTGLVNQELLLQNEYLAAEKLFPYPLYAGFYDSFGAGYPYAYPDGPSLGDRDRSTAKRPLELQATVPECIAEVRPAEAALPRNAPLRPILTLCGGTPPLSLLRQ